MQLAPEALLFPHRQIRQFLFHAADLLPLLPLVRDIFAHQNERVFFRHV